VLLSAPFIFLIFAGWVLSLRRLKDEDLD